MNEAHKLLIAEAIIATMNEAHKLLIADKDAEIHRLNTVIGILEAAKDAMTNREIDQRALLIAKDAEVQRLKEENSALENSLVEEDAEVQRLKEHIIFLVSESIAKNKIITELCARIEELGAREAPL